MNPDSDSSVDKGERIDHKPAKRRMRRARLLLLLSSLLLCLFVIEVGLRIAGFSYPEFYTVDNRRGYALRPGVAGWYRKEGEAYVTINRDGLRDREHSKTKPSNTIRVAVLGDSFTEALQVPFENSFCAVLEQKLRECPAHAGKEVEVINFGVSGYGTAQELITLRDQVWQYSPDIVLLAFTTNNDISDNVRELKGVNQIPYFLVLQDGTLVEDQSFLNVKSFRLRQSFIGGLGRWFRDHLRIVQGIDLAIRNYKVAKAVRQATPASTPSPASASTAASPAPESTVAPSTAPPADIGIDNQVYREPSNQSWNEAWRTTEGLIKAMDQEVRSHGAQFLVLTLSNGIQVTPNPQTRAAFLRAIGARDIFYPDLRIRDFCQRENIPVLTLAPALQKFAETNHAFLHGFGQNLGNGHWNVQGHQVAGEMVASEICAMSAR
jgi:hypothetical protein